MFALPIDDRNIFVITQSDFDMEEGEPLNEYPDKWHCSYLQFSPYEVDTFETAGAGIPYSGTFNPITGAVWILSRDELYIISRMNRTIGRVPLPVERANIFDVCFHNRRFYIALNGGNVWHYDIDIDEWIATIQADPPPSILLRLEDESDNEFKLRQHKEHKTNLRAFPPIYKILPVGDDVYFLGALGRVLCLKKDQLKEVWIDSAARLVEGCDEDSIAVICGDDPAAVIYRGCITGGFEKIFENDDRAAHLTARHGAVRYIGAAQYPGSNGQSLMLVEDEELVPAETGCEREPGNLIRLQSTGGVLWAVDLMGIFRFFDGKWSLTEFRDLRVQ